MADNDFNIIKPMEGLHNVTGLKPIDQRQHKRRSGQGGSAGHEEQPEENPGDAAQSNNTNQASPNGKNDQHSIDYKA